MSKRPDRAPKLSELHELTQLLLILLEAAKGLPNEPEKQATMKAIGQDYYRMAALIRLSEPAES